MFPCLNNVHCFDQIDYCPKTHRVTSYIDELGEGEG